MKKVLTFGTFDFFHPGHVYYLLEAKKYGDTLITIVARDQTVQKYKGYKPFQNEHARVKAVQSAGIADQVILGNIDDYYTCIKDIQPSVICLGYDQQHLVQDMEAYLAQHDYCCTVVRIPAFYPDTFKSSYLKTLLSQQNSSCLM